MEFRLAKNEDRKEIMEIFQVSFKETDENLNFFFNHKFKNNNCVVCKDNNKIVAFLNMFDTKLVGVKSLEKANYIYAAATHPLYRKNGYMSKLIIYSNMLAESRGHKYSTLLPATDSLYKYYQKLGYINFFKSQFLELNQTEIVKYVNNILQSEKILSFDNLNRLRFNICKDHLGTIIWNSNDIKYASEMNQNYGGTTVCSNDGYAICYKSDNDTLQIIEFMVDKNNFNNLITLIYNKYPDLKSYKFRLPLFNNYFGINGCCKNFGMIKPLNKSDFTINKYKSPYLGLPLD